MSDTGFVHQVSPTVNTLGSRYYFAAETVARAEELGIDPLSFYVVGRGGVLGDVEAPVVVSAFGYFNADMLTALWDATRNKVDPRTAGRAHLACCDAFGRKHLTDLDGLAALAAGLEAINDAASRSLAGLALYAGLLGEPLPDDLPARAMRLIALLREHRGGLHLTAVVAAGMDPAVAHYLRRPTMWGTFGWRSAQKPVVTELDRRRLAEIDATTDRLVAPAYGVLDEDGQRAVALGLAAARAAIGDDGAARPA